MEMPRIVDRVLSLLALLAFAAFVGTILWFVPELDLVVIVAVVVAVAAYFLIFTGFKSE